jgi:LEA14-like dessication related protein
VNPATRGARLVIVLFALAALGCRDASRYVYKPPTVAFRAVRLASVGLDGGSLRVALLVRNPNFYSLSTAGMRYRLLVHDSVTIADGADSTHRRVPANDSTVVELPLHVTWRGLSAAAGDVVSNGLVTYRIVGDITLDTPIGTHDLPISQTGRFAPLR